MHPESVFSVGIRSVFLGIYHTDTEGKLGRYISVLKRGQCPPFSSKGGNGPLFEDNPLWKKGGRKGGKYKKDDYIAIIAVISKLMKTLKAEGAVAMESHVENPEASAIFGEFPKMLNDHGLIGLICDTIRLMVVSSGTLSPYAVEDVMTTDQSMTTKKW